MLAISFRNNKSPSVIALSRQKVNPVRKEYIKLISVLKGAYEI